MPYNKELLQEDINNITLDLIKQAIFYAIGMALLHGLPSDLVGILSCCLAMRAIHAKMKDLADTV